MDDLVVLERPAELTGHLQAVFTDLGRAVDQPSFVATTGTHQ